MRAGQRKKVAIDALKLITLARGHENVELIFAFADEEAAAYALGAGWLADALKTWNVRVVVIEIEDQLRHEIRAAQVHQIMLNPEDDAESVPPAV